jgi:hypothetical protein
MQSILGRTLIALCLGFVAVPSLAQPASVSRIHGQIERIDGAVLFVRDAAGEIELMLGDNTKVFALTKGTLADIKPGDFIGAGAIPQPDGSQKAIQIMIFAESMRGLGEGHRPWNRPGTTMTNATVTETVSRTDGPVLTVKYQDGEKKIVVDPETVIRRIVASDRGELKAGAAIAASAMKKPDGSLEATRISVGRDGIEP